jgi:hypothetical protein
VDYKLVHVADLRVRIFFGVDRAIRLEMRMSGNTTITERAGENR